MHTKITILLVVLAASCVFAWPYGEQKIRGVNAGTWLVLEKWMSPSSVFAGAPDSVVDEYLLSEYLGPELAKERLTAHRDTWVTEAEFEFWASTGLNHVRLPIGYWALDIKEGEPWVNGSWEYVVKAAGWAKKHKLQLMIDLHAAPGSQNGWDHSGRSGVSEFFTDENINRTVQIMGQIAQWANLPEWNETVTIIQLLNEPTLWDDYDYRFMRLKEYYDKAYKEIRKYNDMVVISIHDAFIDYSNWYYFGENPEYKRVMLDAHLYQVFGDEWPLMTCEEHHQHPCTYSERLAAANEKLWTIVGEWSLATPNEMCNDQDVFARQQIGAFEMASGWFMWAHNNGQNMREWSFKDSYANKWINPSANNTLQCTSGSQRSSVLQISMLMFSFLLCFLWFH